MEIKRYTVGDTLRMKHYPTAGGFRVWKVVGVHLGATNQEGTYALNLSTCRTTSQFMCRA